MKDLIIIVRPMLASGVDECLTDIKLRTALVSVGKGCFHNFEVYLSFEVVAKECHPKMLMNGLSGKFR